MVESVRQRIKDAAGSLTVWAVLNEDVYETQFGDGFYLHAHGLALNSADAERLAALGEALARKRSANRRSRLLHQQLIPVIEEYREKLMGGSVAQTPEATLMRRQLGKLMEVAIGRLPDTFRPVFVLREIEGLSVEDTAEALQIPKETVKTRFFRARRLLQKELDPELRGALSEAFTFAGADCEALTETVLARFLGSGRDEL
jgi:RNA polymerase sigma factor (sigma-70 family)